MKMDQYCKCFTSHLKIDVVSHSSTTEERVWNQWVTHWLNHGVLERIMGPGFGSRGGWTGSPIGVLERRRLSDSWRAEDWQGQCAGSLTLWKLSDSILTPGSGARYKYRERESRSHMQGKLGVSFLHYSTLGTPWVLPCVALMHSMIVF